MGQKYRWELIKADYNVRIAKEQVRIAKVGYMPTVAVGAVILGTQPVLAVWIKMIDCYRNGELEYFRWWHD